MTREIFDAAVLVAVIAVFLIVVFVIYSVGY
jgi:hypothetical protein